MSNTRDINVESARALVKVLEGENDIVRIVDPVTREVLYWPSQNLDFKSSRCLECNAVWGRGERCKNCSSLEALRLEQRTFKMELNNSHMFWVQSRPLTLNGRPCVLETVNDVTEGLLIDGGDNAKVTDLIGNLNRLVVTDAMTSLFNRRFLEDFIGSRLPLLEKDETPLNVAMVDLDNMKAVNDQYGHQAGDAVLKDVAGFLKLHFSADHPECFERYAVRYGGDEFLVIDVGGDSEHLEAEMRNHYMNMRRICYYDELEIPFSLSCGFSSSDELGWNWSALMEAADGRMYADKHARR